jgi:cobalt/nickel transport system permease protein
MHIPDGFLNFPLATSLWITSGTVVAIAIRRLKLILEDKLIPLMGISSAFIFCAQILNFPIAGGTSGHLIGGALAGILLGPWAGIIVISSVLIVQCLVFQDGGLTALGANVFNMGVIGAGVGYLLFAQTRRLFKQEKGIVIATLISSWCSVLLASFFTALELGISGISPLKVVLFAMLTLHSIIGIVEAIITSLVIATLLRIRPDMIMGAGGITK